MTQHPEDTMRTSIITALIAASLLASLTACGSGDPSYTVRLDRNKDGSAMAYLNLPDATTDEAEAAIRDYASTISGSEWVTILISDETGPDGGLICSATWMKDEKAAQKWGGRFKSDTWPGLDVRCPGAGEVA
ncbi:hypothetical protein ACFW9O_08115 [Streptomyces sp. NPDC059499]|uniref:hypothetical protein n=1 Tax=Streptomyces sp. NPDC059499 TaxID=3346852 RepID=UPI0036AFB435